MARGRKPANYRLSPAAKTDLEDIWLYTARNWSADHADQYTDALENAFDTILAMPEIARERREFTPSVRVHPSARKARATGWEPVIRIVK